MPLFQFVPIFGRSTVYCNFVMKILYSDFLALKTAFLVMTQHIIRLTRIYIFSLRSIDFFKLIIDYFYITKIFKSGEISEGVSHRKQSPCCDTCLSCAITPHPPRRLPTFLILHGRIFFYFITFEVNHYLTES